jgi:hypothetical protein
LVEFINHIFLEKIPYLWTNKMDLENIPEIKPNKLQLEYGSKGKPVARIVDKAEITISRGGFMTKGLYYVLGRETSRGVLYVKSVIFGSLHVTEGRHTSFNPSNDYLKLNTIQLYSSWGLEE